MFDCVFGERMSYGDTEFGGNWNLKGNVGVQEVRVVQSVQGPLVNRLEKKKSKIKTDKTDVRSLKRQDS